MTVSATVQNRSDFAADEVVQAYVKNLTNPLAVKNHSLCAFQRVRLAPGERKTVRLAVRPEAMMVVDEDGGRRLCEDRYTLFVGFSQPDARSITLTGKTPIALNLS